jgi:hypothetical protein
VVRTTSYAGLAFDICGSLQTLPVPSAASTGSIGAEADGVLKISPRSSAEAGANSTLALFVKGYPGLTVSSSQLKVPAASGPAVTYTDGEACPAGTPDAGKQGQVIISSWKSFAALSATTSNNPAKVHVYAGTLTTVAFVPKGAKVQKPSQTTVQAVLKANAAAAQTPSSVPAVSTTSTSGVTTTTSAVTTTTTKK